MEPGPTNYQTGNFYALGSIKSVPKFTVRQAGYPTEFGYVKPGQSRPDMGTYTPKLYKRPAYKIKEPVTQPKVSKDFFKNREILKNRVGPSTYFVTPNIQKRNHNTKTFDGAARRFKFNAKVEAVDREDPLRRSVGSCRVDWRRVHLTGMQGKPSPGPGEYVYPSEFGQYVSERFASRNQGVSQSLQF